MFDFEPESSPIILPYHPSVFGPDFDESIINLNIKYPKIQTPSSLDLGKILMEFDSESKKHLEKEMTVGHSSANPAASNSAWGTYRNRINSATLPFWHVFIQ